MLEFLVDIGKTVVNIIKGFKIETWVAFAGVYIAFYAIKKQNKEKYRDIRQSKIENLYWKMVRIWKIQDKCFAAILHQTGDAYYDGHNKLGINREQMPSDNDYEEMYTELQNIMTLNDVYSPIDLWIEIDRVLFEMFNLCHYARYSNESYKDLMPNKRFSSREELFAETKNISLELRDYARNYLYAGILTRIIDLVFLMTSRRFWNNRLMLIKNMFKRPSYHSINKV